MSTKNINLPTIWHRGLKSAKDILQSFDFSDHEMNVDVILEKCPRKTVINWKGNFSNDYLNDENEQVDSNVENEDYSDQVSDLLNEAVRVRFESDPTRQAEMTTKFVNETIPNNAKLFSAKLEQTKSGYLVGNGLTW